MIPLIDIGFDKKAAGEIKKTVQRVIDSKSYILGKELASFERKYSQLIGCRYAVGVASGTDALRIGLRALGIGRDDKVLTVSLTSPFTAISIIEEGAIPVFCDVDEKTWTIDVSDCTAKMDKKVKAIMPVHIYGNPANMKAILDFAKKFKLRVIEDACQAHGATYMNKKIGNFGDIAAFSFYPTKNLGALGDGGIAVTNDKNLAKLMSHLRHGGQLKRFWHVYRGMNSRLDEIQAAVLSTKLKLFRQQNLSRAKIARRYRKALSDLPIEFQAVHDGAISANHLCVIKLAKRDYLHRYLLKRGITTDVYYPFPVHKQPAFANFSKGKLNVTENLSSQLLAIPLYPHLSAKTQDIVIENIKGFFGH